MAGSPGAGKTESSIAIVEMLKKRGGAIVLIDSDVIGKLIPYMEGIAAGAQYNQNIV
jgi:Mrp family chromosome partitioning ATPase